MKTTKLTLLIFFLVACNAFVFAQQTVPKDSLITLERNPGHWGSFGSSCPFYTLTISADGIVVLEPKDYKEHKVVTGRIIKSQITQEQVKQIISEFERIDFYSLNSTFESKQNSKEDCPEHSTDGATSYISITTDGKSKKLEHYHGCRKTDALSKLTNLEDKIEEIVNIKQWFDCHDQKNRIILSSQTNKR